MVLEDNERELNMPKKESLQRVALTLPGSLLQRLDGQLAAERQHERKLNRSTLIRRCVQFYLDNRQAIRDERAAFAQGVEGRLTNHQREQTLLCLALFYLEIHAHNLPTETRDAALQWAAQNVDHVQKLLPPAKPK